MAETLKPLNLSERLQKVKQRALNNFGVTEEQLHLGHYMLAGLTLDPQFVIEIDAATEQKHTNLEVAAKSSKLADAMQKSGLKTGDHVVLLGPNTIWMSLPFYACHYNGYASCAVDPIMPEKELGVLFANVRPKMVFCSKISKSSVKKVLADNNLDSKVVVFQGPYDVDAFIKEFKGNENGYKPAIFDKKETTAWLILTSGTTGMPKAAVVTHDHLLKNAFEWWKVIKVQLDRLMALSSLQWVSSLMFFVTSPVIGGTRIQTSGELTPVHIRNIINKYKPQYTAFTPYVLTRFIQQEGDACDMSSFVMIAIAGGLIDRNIYLKLRDKCRKCYIPEMYGMTESLTAPFINVPNTPVGSTGLPNPAFSFKLIDEDGSEINEPNRAGELWWKGGYFFKEYLNNPEETAQVLTPDGWLKTGDLFYRDENNFYFFQERKKLLIRYRALNVAPVEIENVIKMHPKVSEVVVVGIPEHTDLATAAIMTKDGAEVDPKEIFDLVNKELPVHKRLHGGLFFVNEFPITAGGKISRPAVLKKALQVERYFDPKSRIKSLISKFDNNM